MTTSRYAFVDAIPDSLFDAVVGNAHGKLRPRAEAIIALRGALLAGQLPAVNELRWPDAGLREPLLAALARSGIARHCAANPRITDEAIASLLGATDVAQKRYDELLAELTLAAREHDKRLRTVGLVPGDLPSGDVLIDDATWQRLRDEAARIAGHVALEVLDGHRRTWQERNRDWIEVRQLLADLCASSNIDDARIPGLLQVIDWRHSAELRKVLAGLPPLASLIRALGRLQAPVASESTVLESRTGPVTREITVERRVREIGNVEIRGVERSDEVTRMLPSEAMLRIVPATRLLWHARRAERALLAYHADATHVTHETETVDFRDGMIVEHARAERGPIIIILDTSGSMAGRAEVIAKALVLQVMCIAELEGRACYTYNFSGAGDLVEHELAFAGDGLARALAFLTLSFSGGTNISEALRRAVTRLESETWSHADVLVVTDGLLDTPDEPFDRATLRMLDCARRRTPFRLHVALAPPSITFRDAERWVVPAIADQVHDLAEWLNELRPEN